MQQRLKNCFQYNHEAMKGKLFEEVNLYAANIELFGVVEAIFSQ